MKQIAFIPKLEVIQGEVNLGDLSECAEDNQGLGFFDATTGKLLTDAPTDNFSIAVLQSDERYLVIPEVDLQTLSVGKTKYKDGAVYTATITIPTPVVGKEYTVIITKKGTVFNQRSNWSFTSYAKNTTAADVAKDIVNQINKAGEQLGVTASNSAGAITVTAVTEGDNYQLTGADELMGVSVTNVTEGAIAVLGKEYLVDLYHKCVAGKGINYLAEDGKELYPSYKVNVPEKAMLMYTLRFAVGRASAKTRDERVYQTVHLVLVDDTNSHKASELLEIMLEGKKIVNSPAGPQSVV
uniref:Capsid protein n=1 Tax=Geladintestivirus 2 TaxID=3233134 RepID=A0AAU8MIM5_9CAUD